MNNEFRGWPKGEPVGILIGEEEFSEEDVTILSAYQALGVPRVGSLPEGLEIVSLMREEAQDALIGKTLGKSVPNTKIPDVISDFDPDSGMDDDALYYASVAPDYDDHNLNMDGEAKTQEQCRRPCSTIQARSM